MKSPSWIVIAIALWACDSNPTPHPGADAGIEDQDTAPTTTPGDPDEDGDRVAECTQAGGYWDGETCQDGLTGAADTAEADDVAAEPAADGDALVDAADADAEDAMDGADGEDAADERDAGPEDADPDGQESDPGD